MKVRAGVLLLLAGFGAGVLVFYLLGKVGLIGLPTSPGEDEQTELSLLEESRVAESRLEGKFPELSSRSSRRSKKPITLRVTEHELRDLALVGLARHPQGRRVLELIQELDVEVDEDELGVELVVDFSKIPRDLLQDKELETLEKIEKILPVIGQSDLDLGFYGTPEAVGGELRLGGDPTVKLSILRLSLGTVSERLGIEEEDLRRSLVLDWPGYRILDVGLSRGALEMVVEPEA